MSGLRILQISLRLIFYSSILFLNISVFSLTIGQSIPIEFDDWKIAGEYYNIVFGGFPIAVLLTLAGTIKRKYSVTAKVSITALTLIAAVFSFILLVGIMFQVGFGAWENKYILFQNKKNTSITINEQRFDAGVFGYGGTRTVKLKPFLWYWNMIKHIDTTSLNEEEWLFIKKEDN